MGNKILNKLRDGATMGVAGAAIRKATPKNFPMLSAVAHSQMNQRNGKTPPQMTPELRERMDRMRKTGTRMAK